jgi:hypothetical protein
MGGKHRTFGKGGIPGKIIEYFSLPYQKLHGVTDILFKEGI